MFKFFSKWSNNSDHHLIDGKSIKEEFELLKTPHPSYGSLLSEPTKDIKLFSLCPSARYSFEKKLSNLNGEQVNESEPKISTGMRH